MSFVIGNLVKAQTSTPPYEVTDAGIVAANVPSIAAIQTWALAQTFSTAPILPNNIALASFKQDGTTVVSLIKINASSNITIAAENNCSYVAIGGSATPGGSTLLIHYSGAGGGIFFESSGADSYGQDMAGITVDISNNILLGNSGAISGSSDSNNTIFQVQTGKAHYWTENGVTVLSLVGSKFGVRTGLGTAPVFANVGGAIFDDYSEAPSVHTDGTEDTLTTHTVLASTLARPGDKIVSEEVLTLASSATAARQIRKYFAGTKTFDSGSITTASATTTVIRQTIMQDGASTQTTGSITGATNASPIVVTSTAHGLSAGAVVVVASVGGNTNANGTWLISAITANTFTLLNSSGNSAYTSGGTWTSGGAVRVEAEAIPASVGAPQYTRITNVNLTNNQLITTTGTASGTGAAAADITGKLQSIRYLPTSTILTLPQSLLPIAWFKASVGTFQTVGGVPAVANNDPVGSWLDQSLYGNNVQQATAGYRPLLKTNWQNGLPVLLFDGIDDFLGALFTLAAPVYACWVGQLISNGAGGGASQALVQETTHGQFGFTFDLPGEITGPSISYSSTPGTDFYTFQSLVNGGPSSSYLTINAANKVTGNGGTSLGTNGIYIGKNSSGTSPGNIAVGEFLLFNRALSTADENNLQAYLRTGWGHY